MTMTPTAIFKTTVSCLNTPFIKEGVKNIAGVAACAFGIFELYEDITWIVHKCQGQGKPSNEPSESQEFSWVKTAGKVILITAKISLILSCFTSRPGQMLCSWTAGKIFTDTQLLHLFGANTIFAVNPWHPKHVVSITACVLGIPATLKVVYESGVWITHKMVSFPKTDHAKRDQTDGKIEGMAAINTLFSRPWLHVANQLSRFILRKT